MELLKNCQVCNYKTYLTFIQNDKISCNLCCSDENTTCIDDKLKSIDPNYHYIYCKSCFFLFRFNKDDLHHDLNIYGKIYFIEIIDKYKLFGKEYNCIPTMSDLDKLVESINMNWIEFHWISQKIKDECCICFNETTNTTECNHIVCSDCVNKIDKCPMCRKEKTYKIKNIHDDDDDDDDDDDYDPEN